MIMKRFVDLRLFTTLSLVGALSGGALAQTAPAPAAPAQTAPAAPIAPISPAPAAQAPPAKMKPTSSTSDGVLSRQNSAANRDLTATKPSNEAITVGGAPGSKGPIDSTPVPSGPPPIAFDPPILNLGEMQADVPKTGKLTIKNISDKPVTIARAIPGCGCTTANAPKDPIPVGGSTEMEITLKPGPKQGVHLSKRVTFQIDGAAPIVLTVEGDVAAYVTVTPDVIEGAAKVGENTTATDGKLVVAAADGQAFKVTGANPNILGAYSPDAAKEHILNIDWAKWDEQGRAIKLTISTDHPKAAAVSVMIKRPMLPGDRPPPPTPTPRTTATPTSELVVAAQQGDAAKVKALLAVAGTNVNQVDPDTGRTALHWAARENRGEIVAILIEAKADINAQDRTGKGPITLAAETGSADATRRLADAGASLTNRDSIGGTPLSWACGLGTAETVEILLNKGADATIIDVNGLSPLIWAAGIGKPESVAILLSKNPNLDLNLKDGVTGDSALMRAVRSGKVESVKLLIDAKADVNSVNKQGYSPMQLAALSGSPEKVKLLLAAKADLNLKDATGRTALDLAQRRTDASGKEIADLLVANGAVSAVPLPAPAPPASVAK